MQCFQLLYDNIFSSLFEYEEAFFQKEIDWKPIVEGKCPLCGRLNCLRQIASYRRFVIELFPFQRGLIPIARFRCRKLMRTVSMLPYQLAPYHQYSIESIMKAVFIWCYLYEECRGKAWAAAEKLPEDCDVTPWLLRNWLGLVVVGFRSAHSVLCQWYDLSDIHSGDNPVEKLREVSCYLRKLKIRGPPEHAAFRFVLQRYGCHSGRHFLGIPSQDRMRLSCR